ncbi:MAG: hypothetical protein GWP10_14080, partial [Nitrospiraceae bacterium]|nr:hypothetical protein [Nitrospiraceae bacterium]
MENSKTGIKIILTFIVLFCGAIFFTNSLVVIDAGEVGVRLRFGKIVHEDLFPGIHIKLPMADEIVVFPTRVEKIDMAAKKGNPITALSVEGLPVTLDVTVLYRINPNKADEIYKNYGTDFDEKIVIPITREIVRNVVSQYNVEDLYSTKRAELQEKVYNQLKKELRQTDISLVDFLLRNVKLPPRIVEKIEEKLRAKEEAEKMRYVLQ